MSGIFGSIASAFVGTFIEKLINGLLQYFERAQNIRQAKDLGASEQLAKDTSAAAQAEGEIHQIQNTHQTTAETKKDLLDDTF